MSGSLKRAVAKWAGRVARGGGHSPIRSRPRGKASGARNLEGVAGLLGDSLPRRPGGDFPRARPSRGAPGAAGGLRGCPGSLPAGQGELFPRGALPVSGRSRALSTAGCPVGAGAGPGSRGGARLFWVSLFVCCVASPLC